MEVAVGIRRAVVVDDDVHSLNIDSTAEDIRSNKYSLLEGLEGGIAVDT